MSLEEATEIVEGMLDEVIEDVRSGRRAEIVVREEAERIIEELQEEDPEAIFVWFAEHMASILGQRLQVALAAIRRNGRRSAFTIYEERENGDGDDYVPPPASPFLRPYAVGNGRWKSVGEMVRADWKTVLEDRLTRAHASLFDVELAKRILEKLPDEETPTRSVLSEAELGRLERDAEERAKDEIRRLRVQARSGNLPPGDGSPTSPGTRLGGSSTTRHLTAPLTRPTAAQPPPDTSRHLASSLSLVIPIPTA